jgi:fatty acid desaturase
MQTECVVPETLTWTDEDLRMCVRAQLPAEVFRRRPWRLIYVAILLGIIGACGWGAMHAPWYAAIPLSMLMGHTFAVFMFFGHEIAHGAVIGSRRLQDLVLYLTCAPYCLSPGLWRMWHNVVHHAHAHVDVRDPDHFGSIARYERGGFWRRLVIESAPGSGRLLSYLYFFLFFSGHAQGVLWVESVGAEEFKGLNRTRAKIESFLMLAWWVALGIATGLRGTLYLVVIPMMAANFVLISYIFTNHLLRPLGERASSLDGTMSVRTLKVIDRLHFHFSHHIEHHLFPAVSSMHYPLIRAALEELVGDSYLAPPHWWAVLVLYRTPRLYAQPTELLEPVTGRRVSIASVEELLELH